MSVCLHDIHVVLLCCLGTVIPDVAPDPGQLTIIVLTAFIKISLQDNIRLAVHQLKLGDVARQ